jgi:hypothetical protein
MRATNSIEGWWWFWGIGLAVVIALWVTSSHFVSRAWLLRLIRAFLIASLVTPTAFSPCGTAQWMPAVLLILNPVGFIPIAVTTLFLWALLTVFGEIYRAARRK